MSEIQELRFELFTARLLLHGTGGGSPWIYPKDSDCRGKMMKLWMKIDMDSELLILCITILN